MTQVPDHTIDNGSGAQVRGELNQVLAALLTLNSGPSAPATTYAYMLWVDTTNGLLKLRNAANTAWIDLPLSPTSSNTVPADLTILSSLIARTILRMGVSGAEWEIDPKPQGSGAEVVFGPRESEVVQPSRGITINRATGKVDVGDATTGGAADHLEVHGGVKVGEHGVTFPDGTVLPTAGVIQVVQLNEINGVYLSSNWLEYPSAVSITPKSATNKILVLASCTGGSLGLAWWRVHRDGSPLEAITTSTINDQAACGNLMVQSDRTTLTQAVCLMDEPATTNEVQYKMAFRCKDVSNRLHVGFAPNDSYGDGWDMRGGASLTLIELGG